MPIQLYAEHLLNIRTLSIQASLDTHSNKETKVQLSADGRTLTLLHDGEQASILLPVAVPDTSTSTLTIPVIPSKDLSFRIRLEGTGADAVGDGEIIVPWTAPSLLTDAEVSCKACKATIVGRGSVTVWKDLPSEGWAEMMDFWHCHKPNEPHDHDHDATGMKGYAANSVLTAVSTVGLVNATSFLLAASDCSSLKVGRYTSHSHCWPFLHPIGQIRTGLPGRKVVIWGKAEIQSSKIERDRTEACASWRKLRISGGRPHHQGHAISLRCFGAHESRRINSIDTYTFYILAVSSPFCTCVQRCFSSQGDS